MTSITTLDDISKFFSVPLSDAAANLGVCTSVLKKICRDNGLDRWPYRKFQSGKSIEEIKKYAARQKAAELMKIGKRSGIQAQNEHSKLYGVTPLHNSPQQASKNIQVGLPSNQLCTSAIKGISTLDEFKYGFPSDGLSTIFNRWWGNTNSETDEHVLGEEADIDETGEKHDEKMTDEGSSLDEVEKERDGNGKRKEQGNARPKSILLTAVRKRTVEEGREALKLGIRRQYGSKELGLKERKLLFRIFYSSLFDK